MILFPLDSKRGCDTFYAESSFVNLDSLPIEGVAWNYSEALPRQSYTYGSLCFAGKGFKDLSPNHLRTQYVHYYNKLLSHYKALNTAKVNLDENCFFDLVPESFLRGLYSSQEVILETILSEESIPEEYEILSKIHEICVIIGNQNLSGNLGKIKYNVFGTKTGRLSTFSDGFSILNLHKDKRVNIKPNNDLFIELDFNGAEIRTLLALSGKPQPEIDIHAWNLENTSGSATTRQEMKERFFAWLYNPSSVDNILEKYYDKKIYKNFYENGIIRTPFLRNLPVDERKALNYLLQSTTSDIVLENTHKLLDLYEDKKTNIAFVMHDSVILDYSREDTPFLGKAIEIFSATRMGKFRTNIKMGKNYGEMREIDV